MNKNLAPKIIQAFDETQKVSGASDHQNELEPVVLSCRSGCKAIKTLRQAPGRGGGLAPFACQPRDTPGVRSLWDEPRS